MSYTPPRGKIRVSKIWFWGVLCHNFAVAKGTNDINELIPYIYENFKIIICTIFTLALLVWKIRGGEYGLS